MNYGMDYYGGGGGSGIGGGSGGGGGGFANEYSQGSGGGGGGSGTRRKNYDDQSIQPCTIGMILQAKPQGDGLELELADGRKLSRVVIVAGVREYQPASTNILYEVEDGTGLLSVKQWVDQGDCAAKFDQIKQCQKDHIYVKIIGVPKYFDGSVTLAADSIRPLITANEIAHHMLEVVFVGEKLKNQIPSLQRNLVPMTPGGVGFGGRPMGTALHRSMDNPTNGSVRDIVLNYIRTEGDKVDIGINMHQCIRILGREYNEDAVRAAFQDLSAEGHIYSTVNEDYYKFAL